MTSVYNRLVEVLSPGSLLEQHCRWEEIFDEKVFGDDVLSYPEESSLARSLSALSPEFVVLVG